MTYLGENNRLTKSRFRKATNSVDVAHNVGADSLASELIFNAVSAYECISSAKFDPESAKALVRMYRATLSLWVNSCADTNDAE